MFLRIPPTCVAALASAVTSPGTYCLNGPDLVALFLLNSNTSVVGPLNSWFTGLCAAPACTNETIAEVIGNVTAASACEGVFGMFGLTSPGAISEIIAEVQAAYPLARELACLMDEAQNELCVVETLGSVQSRAGALTFTTLQAIGSNIAYGAADPSLLGDVACNACTKASVDVLLRGVPSVFTTDFNGTIASECGARFLDGAYPANISQSGET
ncbi:hypothetical protein B0H21DRAFT_425021 [Amylocystis lapponica]|nr:hypothetical protein B0H21DRAFT_425021 [Amylocystis lapponica]